MMSFPARSIKPHLPSFSTGSSWIVSFVRKTKGDPRSHTNQHEAKHSCLELDPTFEAKLRRLIDQHSLAAAASPQQKSSQRTGRAAKYGEARGRDVVDLYKVVVF